MDQLGVGAGSAGNSTFTIDAEFQERVRVFKEFLEADFGTSPYHDQIKTLLKDSSADSGYTAKRLIVNINRLREYNADLAKGILDAPMDFIPPFEQAIKDVANNIKPSEDDFHVGFEGAFGDNAVSPSSLTSSHLGKTLCIEAIVTRCSLVRPKIARSIHYCEATQLFHPKEFRDGLSLSNDAPTGSVYPKEDDNGNPLTIEFGYSTFKDFQMIYVQEMPERSLAGQMPRPIDVICDDDLVDKVKPGDRISVVGTFRSRGKNQASQSAVFSTVFLANNITLLNKDISQPTLTETDAKEIKKIAKREDVFKLVSSSLAPSLFGHEYIKKALLLLMLGGVEKNLENGTHLRGDINVLLIGDPSVGKSQMLRFVLNLAPLAIATTGRGSSGVGLTAAVTADKETGERTLEAGAMVLADRGVVCIDEFDKMSDIDRVAIHEVMEQQTVTIAKAGIHTSLNARCSVLAAANPAFGSYLDEKKPFENITMPDSLLSRFDLVFVVLDKTDDTFNRSISEHITRLHRYQNAGVSEGVPITESMITSMKSAQKMESDPNAVTAVFEKYNELLHIGMRPERQTSSRRRKKNDVEILSIPFLKKYLYYAKNRITPVLTTEAADYISNAYSELRAKVDGNQDQYRTMPITPRTLETLIRLSTAHAKCRLSKEVEVVDAEVAFEILVFALFKEVKKTKREKRQKTVDDSDDSAEDDDESVTDSKSYVSRSTTSRPSVHSSRTGARSEGLASSGMLALAGAASTIVGLEASQTTANPVSEPGPSSVAPAAEANNEEPNVDVPLARISSMALDDIPEMSEERFDAFKSALNNVKDHFVEERGDSPSLLMSEIIQLINRGIPDSDVFSDGEVIKQIKIMSDDNQGLWYQEDNDSVMFF